DAEEIVDGELIRILALDLNLDLRAIERLREVTRQESSRHHHREDRHGDLPAFVDDVPVVREMDFLAIVVQIHGVAFVILRREDAEGTVDSLRVLRRLSRLRMTARGSFPSDRWYRHPAAERQGRCLRRAFCSWRG